MRRHQAIVGKSGEGMSRSYILEGENIKLVHAKYAEEVGESLRFWEGCKNACLLSLPFWIAVGIIWFI